MDTRGKPDKKKEYEKVVNLLEGRDDEIRKDAGADMGKRLVSVLMVLNVA